MSNLIAPYGFPMSPWGTPVSKDSQFFFVDPEKGVAGSLGTWESPMAGIEEAEDKCIANQHDHVILVGKATASALSAAVTWDKNYTHLVGLSADLPGVGQRARITGSATVDATQLLTVSATGCVFRNLQFFNSADADVDSGAVVVSGNRNLFLNCMISGMGHATPAARAGSYSLTVSGAENHFRNCYIGLDTITRAAANAELVMSGSKNSFTGCTFASQSETIGHFAVKVTGAGTNTWKDSLFHNYSVNWATTLTDVFSTPAGAPTYYVILQWPYQFIGYTGVANNLTHVYLAGPAPSTGSGLSTNPAG